MRPDTLVYNVAVDGSFVEPFDRRDGAEALATAAELRRTFWEADSDNQTTVCVHVHVVEPPSLLERVRALDPAQVARVATG